MYRSHPACRMATAFLTTSAVMLTGAQSVQAADAYPVKTIRVVIGFTAGGNSDAMARPMARRLSEATGQQVIIDNRPGASGNIGMELVARAAPDGYTIFSGPASSLTVNPHIAERMPIDTLRDLAPVVSLGQFTSVLVSHPSLPAKTVADLIALAKQRPGQITFASPGNGTGFHLAGELFKLHAGVKALHVPYAQISPMLADLMGGRVDMMFFSVAVVAPHVKAGKLRAIGTTGRERSPAMPDVPTFRESGLPSYEYSAWHGIFAPATMPKELVERLNELIGKVLALPDVRDFYISQNVYPMPMTPTALAERLRAEHEKWRKVIRDAGIKPGSV